MEQKEKTISEKRKINMKLYSAHKMLTNDLLFYYGIKFLFLTQVKGLTAGNIVLASAFWGIFKVIFQIPVTSIIDKFGEKKCLVAADIIHAFSVVLVMLSNSVTILIISNLFSAIAFAAKEVAEAGILNASIPNTEDRSKIYSKIESNGIGNFYYLSAVSAILSGFLFDINGYIPMTICVIILLFSAKIARNFNEIGTNNNENIEPKAQIPLEKRKLQLKKNYETYFKDLKLAFSFIFNSRRLKALMLYSGFMYGIIMVINTYEMGLLEEIKLSASITGIIYAAMQIIAGISSKHQEKFHDKFKNKTLSVIGISYTIACLIAGIAAISKMPYMAIVAIIVITYIIRYMGMGLYYALIKKYITNFTNVEVANKVYSAHGLVTGLGNFLICELGSILVGYNNTKISMIILGATSLVVMSIILKYMETRVGLKPQEYRKRDINYKEYISLK